MTTVEIISRLNERRPEFINLLGGEIVAVDHDASSCTMNFSVDHRFCHSVNVIQGGFVTAMLDCVMSHAAFASPDPILNVSTLEIKVSFLEPSLAGKFTATGRIVKAGGRSGFMTGELYNEAGLLTAQASTTARFMRPPR